MQKTAAGTKKTGTWGTAVISEVFKLVFTQYMKIIAS